MSVVGIDFGTEACVVAVARRRVIECLQNSHGYRKTPSAVAYGGKQRLVGNDALMQWLNNYSNTVVGMKRLLGRRFDDPEVQAEAALLPFKLVKMPNGYIGVDIQYNDESTILSIEQVTAALLVQLKNVAEPNTDLRSMDAVLSVPFWWTDSQRRALLDAAKIANINVLRLMHETTAIALNYGILRNLPADQHSTVLFVDVGHATTQASLVAFSQGKLKVLAVAADRQLGVRNFEQMLVHHFADMIKKKYKGMDVLSAVKPRLKLTKECERVKKVLSANIQSPFSVEYIMNDVDVTGTITRQEFEELAARELLPRLLRPVQKVLEDGKVRKEDLASVEVVGGGVRIPCIQNALKSFLGRDLSFTCDGDESVARGCVLQCAMLSPIFKVKDFEVTDITNYPIDIAWGAHTAHDQFVAEQELALFPIHNVFPATKQVSFKEHVGALQLVATYPEGANAPGDKTIARFKVSGVPATAPPNAVGTPGLKVKVKMDVNGTIAIHSAVHQQDVQVEVTVPAPGAAPAATGSTDEKQSKINKTDKAEDKATPMETEPTSATPPPAAEPMQVEKKLETQTVRTNLDVESWHAWMLSKEEVHKLYECESQMLTQDKNVAETSHRRNELETYILEMRNAMDGNLAEYVSENERSSFSTALDEMESWLYGDGAEAQKSDYVKRLGDLKKEGGPLEKRKYEMAHRDQHVAQLKSAVFKFQQFAESKDEKWAHIPAADREKVTAECAAADSWLLEMLNKQDRLKKTDNPVLVCADIDAKRAALEKVAEPIMNKPKPAPKKEEPKKEPKKEEKPADPKPMETDEAPTSATPDAAPMDESGAQ